MSKLPLSLRILILTVVLVLKAQSLPRNQIGPGLQARVLQPNRRTALRETFIRLDQRRQNLRLGRVH